MKPFVYQGPVVLGCQEGGYAAPSIELTGLTEWVAGLCDFETSRSLDDLMLETFGPGESINGRSGDVALGDLRITVERIGGSQ